MALRNLDVQKFMEQRGYIASLVTVNGKHIIIKDPEPNGWDYDVAISDCNTHEKILSWVMHLSEKNWVTKDIIRQFIRVSAHASGLKVEGF
ncbi:hypothetical protein [Pantoea septica]|uniref:Uncharacterized protein n=1 Tax=Pantoea septica TaxID=472695 RepID=A0ABX3UNE4_9GAMM|nr:hypothetical protein [Pantoea septica]ORM96265.1 hypothetical protein HA46_17205 [Pantoea septica]